MSGCIALNAHVLATVGRLLLQRLFSENQPETVKASLQQVYPAPDWTVYTAWCSLMSCSSMIGCIALHAHVLATVGQLLLQQLCSQNQSETVKASLQQVC